MTGNTEYLDDMKRVKGGMVSFSDGEHGVIEGKGTTSNSELPKLVNDYFVQWLKENLISLSQLCDVRLTVVFPLINYRTITKLK